MEAHLHPKLPSMMRNSSSEGPSSMDSSPRLQRDGLPSIEAPLYTPLLPKDAHHRLNLLKEIDRSTASSRSQSRAATDDSPTVEGSGSAYGRTDRSEAKIVVAMVGLPARGKSYLSNKLSTYLKVFLFMICEHLMRLTSYQFQWLDYEVKVFNVGEYRRKLAQASVIQQDHSSEFFNDSNASAMASREAMAENCLEDLIRWLRSGGNVGIHDATNTTKARRKWLADRVAKEHGIIIMFIESICNESVNTLHDFTMLADAVRQRENHSRQRCSQGISGRP